MKQAVVAGQYEFSKGLFFGGKQLEQGPSKYRSFVAERLASTDRVVAIDVHTGLGKYGEDTLLVEDKDYSALRPVFGERVAPLKPQKSPAYEASGSIGPMLPRIIPKAHVSFVTQEFGTYSSIKVLHALREENRWHHYGGGTLDHATKQNLKDAFDPNDDAWRLRVLERGRDLFNQASALLLSEMDRLNVSSEADALHKQGREAGGRGDYKRAIAFFERASNLAPEWAYPVYDMAYTYLLMKDFDNARTYYRKTVELEPRGFFTAITALDALEREAKGVLPSGTYLAYVFLEWIDDSEKKAEGTRQLAEKVPGFAPVWKDIAYLAKTDTERLEAIEKGLAAHPDHETKEALLTNKALVLDRQGDHDRAVRLLEELVLDPQLPSGPEHMARVILASLAKK